jgi:hypothetical protein
MAEKNRSMYMEELDLIEFLVAHVASLSSFVAVEVACEVVVAESPTLPLVGMDLQSASVVSSAIAIGTMRLGYPQY